jgi:glycolate oxidase iron-sulfur subunit
MIETDYYEKLSMCVRCGACKSSCPTYLTTLNETMGARGRVAMLAGLGTERLEPTKELAEKIFSCMLCGACKGQCPTGIDIPEIIYHGRTLLKSSYQKGRLMRTALKYSVSRLDTVVPIVRGCQKVGMFRSIPGITSKPFKKRGQVYKNINKISRIIIFAGCGVNYFYPDLGDALSSILFTKGYEVVVFGGEACCGEPLRAMGLEKKATALAKKNIEHFNKVRAGAIVSLCPTCTMSIKEQYPVLAGDTIPNIMDLNEFLIRYRIAEGLEIDPRTVTFHDPCHLSNGLGIREEPRQILKDIKGIELVEMKNPNDCCGFAGLFSSHFKEISLSIGRKKIKNISSTPADTVVTSCPGCMIQLERIKKEAGADFSVRHVVEIIDEAMHG